MEALYRCLSLSASAKSFVLASSVHTLALLTPACIFSLPFALQVRKPSSLGGDDDPDREHVETIENHSEHQHDHTCRSVYLQRGAPTSTRLGE